jgi:hypothetical protein
MKEVRMAGIHILGMGDMKNAHKNLHGNSKGKNAWRPRCRHEDNTVTY